MLCTYLCALFSFGSIRLSENSGITSKVDIEKKVIINDYSLNQYVTLTDNQQVAVDKYSLSTAHVGFYNSSFALEAAIVEP